MAKYCCFNCPEIGHDDTREKEDTCPTCSSTYGFPLTYAPQKIGKYDIIKPISRGFYGAVYQVKDEILGKDYVLKIIPKSIYALHKKDFFKECKDHAELAKGSAHIVGISSAEEETVTFKNGNVVDCYVAVLDYIPGRLLKDLLLSSDIIPAAIIAQIAIDLFRILDVLKIKHKNHNDLHPENIIIQNLSKEERRPSEIEGHIRVVAIDIGSLTSENKAGDSPDRHGDVHWVADYLIKLSEKLIRHPDEVTDQNYRLASLLEDRAKLLFPIAEYQRSPNFDEVTEDIENCFNQQAFPWEEPLKLLNFNDTYNAQTLDPWFVPSLLVDPSDQWLNRISGKGPLVITGMRGCGKTMMLRALQFHARAANSKINSGKDKNVQIERLKNEGYIGIYVSCNKLLDEIGKPANQPLHQPFSRLFIRYGIEAIQALRHLKSISESYVKNDYYKNFIEVYREHLTEFDLLDNIQSEYQLEQQLLKMIYSLNKGEEKYIVKVNPSNAFPALAQTIRKCSKLWYNNYILFLLDDVSTRYLGEENIRNLLSSLIFQSEECAFKITSEVQTIELVLFSPGKIEKAKKGRDFETFDLGSAVNEKIRNKGGKKFVADILNRRANGNIKHPPKTPAELLGDTTLTSIAKSIVNRGDDKTLRKSIYFGMTALAGVCVGDIGDIINLYDLIIRHYDQTKQIYPIPSNLQSECFQNLCSTRLHEVNKRGSSFKDFAISFAEASHQLLMKSSRDGSSRLREYYSIYVRITTGNMEAQYQKIRELLDAGIFVYSGGASTPRALGNDTNPINQFKLTYRKLYGISNLIGLTQGDRFELTGEDLENWLNNPANGKEILIKNVGGVSSNVDQGDDLDEPLSVDSAIKTESKFSAETIQGKLPFGFDNLSDVEYYEKDEIQKLVEDKTPICNEIKFQDLQNENFDYLIVALGFEDRTLHSLTSLLRLKPKKVMLIQYEEQGKSQEIIEEIKKAQLSFEIVNFEQVKTSFDALNGNIICDITGMSKSLIFNVVRNTLKTNSNIFISHTSAKQYYPLNEQIQSALERASKNDNYGKLEIITDEVIKGEQAPYEIYDLLFSDTDESKRNLLVGFSNSKYERLFKILENRSFDKLVIITPQNNTPRTILSNLAAEVISVSSPNSEITSIDTNDLKSALRLLTLKYQEHYIDQNYNCEFALTGSKLQTVACATISAAFKISHGWYVKPSKWDVNEFSNGIGNSIYFKIQINAFKNLT
ncbi:MAG: hypothetical protein ABIN01_18200 [Ferruginibacter sp.]